MDHMHVTPTTSGEIRFMSFSKTGDIHICWRSFSSGTVFTTTVTTKIQIQQLSKAMVNARTYCSNTVVHKYVNDICWKSEDINLWYKYTLVLFSSYNQTNWHQNNQHQLCQPALHEHVLSTFITLPKLQIGMLIQM